MSAASPSVSIIIRRKEVEARTGLSRSAIYDKLDTKSPSYDATFPTQIRLGTGSVGWIESEVKAWIESRITASRNATATRPTRRKSVRKSVGEYSQ
ncbi:helix-turn-helix transcriptional regulator [Chitinimonas sp. PSY-7]|uniref:AlpA family phage regulatory protein n=1 Tax=Chitinimonas sp. PSY-7 TaxID=3459088 RepID=UPI00403FE736